LTEPTDCGFVGLQTRQAIEPQAIPEPENFMPLEDALNRNSDLIEKHNDLLERLLAKAGSLPDVGAAAADPAKATRGKGKDKTPTVEDQRNELKAKIAAWLTEFPDKDPETEDRGGKLKAALTKLEVKVIGEITTQENLDRLKGWFEKKHAAGRTMPPWTPEAEAATDDDI
jgi:hypothetical protein